MALVAGKHRDSDGFNSSEDDERVVGPNVSTACVFGGFERKTSRRCLLCPVPRSFRRPVRRRVRFNRRHNPPDREKAGIVMIEYER